MTGDLEPLDGMVKRHNHLKIGMYHQHLTELLDPELNPLEYMVRKSSHAQDCIHVHCDHTESHLPLHMLQIDGTARSHCHLIPFVSSHACGWRAPTEQVERELQYTFSLRHQLNQLCFSWHPLMALGANSALYRYHALSLPSSKTVRV